MPIGEAYDRCPEGVFLPVRHSLYREYSRRVFQVVGAFAEAVQQISIDEAFVDLSPVADPEGAAREIKQRFRDEVGLVASVGLAGNKLVAKIATDEVTFQRDESDKQLLWKTLKEQAANCAARLRERGFLGRTVTVKLRCADFRTSTRSLTLGAVTDDPQVIASAAAALMRQWWAPEGLRLRLLGLRLSGLKPTREVRQLPPTVRRGSPDHHRCSNGGPVPEPFGVLQVEAQAAVTARPAEGAQPVVVVERGSVVGEVLGVQHVL